jgi:hypothetical protein
MDGKSAIARECLVVEAVSYEPVSPALSLLTGKTTGKNLETSCISGSNLLQHLQHQ